MRKILKFWGTRGSTSVSGPEYSYFGGNTSCAEIEYEDTHLIIDAGTGIRSLGHTLQNRKKIDLFISHFHWDHIIGFPFFEPAYKKDVQLTIWTPEQDGKTARELFREMLEKQFFPVQLNMLKAKIEFRMIEEKKPLQIGSLIIDFHRTLHPNITFSFKIKTPRQIIGYVTDNEVNLPKQQSFIEFYRGVDVFVHEAQYAPQEYQKKEGWGHSNLEKVMELVKEVRPGKWLVVHHDPQHSDADLREMEKFARSNHPVCPIEWVRDGHTLNLS
jgi:phosphoribosyl 1,2-cyclic phosphodiesterase